MTVRTDNLIEKADALFKAASECHRQHTRYSKLVETGAPEDDQREALEMAYICDDSLASAMTAYEKEKGHSDGHAGEPWWHKGNMLWHASREYIRRHANCDGIAKRLGRQSPTRLAELALSFDLDASALLSLRMAADAYRTARPEVE